MWRDLRVQKIEQFDIMMARNFHLNGTKRDLIQET